jgi:hypothetical protein
MTDHSQNGWPVLTPAQLTWFTAAGERFAAANADVASVAAYLITHFDAEVEPIAGKVLDDWSYAQRDIRGSTTTISNHASATAWDLNATKHPRGVKGTFSAAETAAVRSILGRIVDDNGNRIFRWGNDFVTAPIDSMHFEINATGAQVAQARVNLENDMQWGDKITLTATDAKIWGAPYKEGDEVTFGVMVRYPTLARKTEQELQAFVAASAQRDAAMKAQLDALTKAVAALTPAPVTPAEVAPASDVPSS